MKAAGVAAARRAAAARLRRSLAGGLVLAVAAAVVAAAAGRSGDRAAALDLGTGTAWFASVSTGSVALLDGSTAARVAVAPLGAAPAAVVQGPAGSAYVRVGDTLRRVDGASLEATPAAQIPFAAGDEVVVAGTAVWTVARRGTVVQQRDPGTLDSAGPPAAFPGVASSVVGADDGVVWAVGGDTVASFADARLRTRAEVPGVSAAQVVLAGEDVVVADAAAARAVVVDAGTGRPSRPACLDVAPDAVLSGATDSPWVLAVSSAAATVTVSDVRREACGAPVALDDSVGAGAGGDPARFGAAVERRGRVYVPDTAAGRVLVVDPGVDPPSVLPVDLRLAGRSFRLMSHHGFVWFDDPTGDIAGVITEDDTVIAVSKGERGPHGEAVTTEQPVDPDTACLGPTEAQVGAPVRFDVASTLDPQPAWRWSSPRASPAEGVGPAFTTSWSTRGSKTVEVADASGGPHAATCRIRLTSDPPPPTPPTTMPPPVTPIPPPPIPVPPAGPPEEPVTTTTTDPPTTAVPPPLAPRMTASPDPATAGQPVAFADVTEGAHRLVRWEFPSASPPSSTEPSPTATWSRPGTYTVTLTVERDGAATSTSHQLQVRAPGGLAVSVSRLATATLREAYSEPLSATGGLPPYTWQVTGGTLPEGLALDPATGQVTGTPVSATTADAAVTVTVTDSADQKTSRTVGIMVALADRWTTIAPMSTPRRGHSVTVLQDGRVLVVGGRSDTNPGASLGFTSAEIYDPRADAWSPTGGMTVGRAFHTATLLPDGNVLVTGGDSEGPQHWTSEIYDPESGRWADAPPRAWRHGHTATLLRNGMVLLLGGHELAGLPVADAELFDPTTQTFIRLPPMPDRRQAFATTALDDGRVLVTGGYVPQWTDPRTGQPFPVQHPTTSWIFDPSARAWTGGPSLGSPRSSHSAVLVGGSVLVAGGYSPSPSSPRTDTEMLTSISGGWQSAAPLSTPRTGGFLVRLRAGYVLATGGSAASMATEMYDPSAAEWRQASARLVTRNGTRPVLLADGRVVVVGGSGEDGSLLTTCEVYG